MTTDIYMHYSSLLSFYKNLIHLYYKLSELHLFAHNTTVLHDFHIHILYCTGYNVLDTEDSPNNTIVHHDTAQKHEVTTKVFGKGQKWSVLTRYTVMMFVNTDYVFIARPMSHWNWLISFPIFCGSSLLSVCKFLFRVYCFKT